MISKKRLHSEDTSLCSVSTANPFKKSLYPTNITITCFPKYIIKGCSCSKQIFPSGCQKKNCLTCQPYLSKRRGLHAYNRFDKYRDECKKARIPFVMLYTDFTIPMQLRSNCMDPKYWQDIRKKVWNLLKTKYHALFALEATHPISEKHPNVFHPHLNFLWVQKPGYKPFLDVKKLEAEYREILGFYRKVDLKHRYSDIIAKQMHWCNYVTRIFPAFADWTGALRWYGTYPALDKKEKFICPLCGCALGVFGWLDHYTVEEYYEHGLRSGRSPPWEDITKINLFKRKKSKEEVA